MENRRPHPTQSRRDFIIRAVKAAAGVSTAGCLGWIFYDRSGPAPQPPVETVTGLPNFSIPAQKDRMAVVRGKDRVKSLREGLAALGGPGEFINTGDRVLIKVNAAFASPPALGATTHPDLVAEIVRLCLKSGAKSVSVTDNPINDPISSLEITGIADAVRSAGGRIVLPRPEAFRNFTLPGAKLIRDWPVLIEPIEEADKLIGTAPVKDHHRSGASMILKNWYGLLGGRRNAFHQDIHTIIQELAVMVRPTLVVLDGTTSMMANGPTGGSLSDLKQTHCLVVGTDPVAADTVGAKLLGRSIKDLPFIDKAQRAGAGSADLDQLSVRTLEAV